MDHRKTPVKLDFQFKNRPLAVQGPLSADRLGGLEIHPGLNAFRPPPEQLEALLGIASLPEGRVIGAIANGTLVGYVTFHFPDELELWSQAAMHNLIELGAIEVAAEYRGAGIAKRMLDCAFAEGQLDNCIVFTTEYYWHWDMKGTGLDVWSYRSMMEKLMASAGMLWMATDDPEICSHPANCLMVRTGPEVSSDSVEQFDRIRFRQRFMY